MYNLFNDIITPPAQVKSDIALTPIVRHGGLWVKRDDLFIVAGINGGKARSCLALASGPGVAGLVTAGSCKLPQINIVASVAQHLGLPCFAHTPQGELGEDLLAAQRKGAIIVQHRAGYNSVIKARAREHAKALGYLEVPFGMVHDGAVQNTKSQILNLPAGIRRIIVPVGSGMSLAGILAGLLEYKVNVPVIGVVVGASPVKILDRFAPAAWRTMATLVAAGVDYHKEITDNKLGSLYLDNIYEAKCLPFLRGGDLLWVVGSRESIAKFNV